MGKKTALVLSGGGARGAYQAGAIKALIEIAKEAGNDHPFQIIVGNSAGAINAAYLAATAHDWDKAADGLVNLWSNIHANEVFATDISSMAKIGAGWIKDVTMGSFRKKNSAQAFLNTRPLWKLLEDNISFEQLQKNLDNGHLLQVAISATDYQNSEGITFVQSSQEFKHWSRPQRRSENAILKTAHVMASSAIPLFFPPIELNGRYMGDGCLRNTAPLSPAVHLGADRMVAIGVRQENSKNQAVTANKTPSIGRVLNTLLNAVLLDALQADVERSRKFNRILKNVESKVQEELGLKAVDVFSVYPSEDIGLLARNEADLLPKIVQYLLAGLGPIEDTSEIVSYLLFEPGFCKTLVNLGYKDTMTEKKSALEFFQD